MAVALNTLAAHGCGRLVVSGYQGEAERLAALAPQGITISIEPTARSTFENVQRSLPFLLDVELIAIASDRGPRPVDQGTVPERSFERGPLGHHPHLLPPGVGGAAPLITCLSNTIAQDGLARMAVGAGVGTDARAAGTGRTAATRCAAVRS